MHVMPSIRAAGLMILGAAALLAQYQYPFQNPNLPMEERVNNIVSLMTRDEKIACLGTNPSVPRLGIQGTGHVEGLHGLALGGPGGWGRPTPIPTTQFAQAIGMGETWDPDLIRKAGGVEGNETRYIYQSKKRGGLVVRAPNADLGRDPRWGRTEECFGEDPFFNGKMVAAMAVTNILQFLPMPNTNAGSIANNYIASGSEKFDSDQVDGRVDYNFSEKLHFFGRYTIADFDLSAPGAYGTEAGGPALNGINFAGSSLDRNQSLALGSTYALSTSLITDIRFGFYRYRIRVQPNGVGTTPATTAGLPGLNLGTTETSGMPAFYINGNGGFNFGYALGVNQCNCPLKETENHFQFVNNWTKTMGNHTFGWGADLRRAQQQR